MRKVRKVLKFFECEEGVRKVAIVRKVRKVVIVRKV